MARKKEKEEQKQAPDEAPGQPRPFWSGVIAFGLVSLPVSLFPANRGKPLSLRMVDKDGTPLARRYFCEKENKPLSRDELVRGFPVEEGRFVIVKDDELEDLAPEKTREIDLRRFVPLDDINPVYFERGYFLAPDSGANKAYRLLARSMADEQRAGIATFVMRGKEYIIAIISEQGILRAETLRFQEEIRSPLDVGLPELPEPEAAQVSAMKKAMKTKSAKKLDVSLLSDRGTERILDVINSKLEEGRDVTRLSEPEADTETQDTDNVVDLMQVLKERLQGREPERKGSTDQSRSKPGGSSSGQPGKSDKEEPNLDSLKRQELYNRAKERDISGRSNMTKEELVDALKRAG
ncbi:Ku protein [Marinobacter salicampi]|uniref:non-homologous end joining protein Ku n=1 Tax=Marinobacter salicampi TaxID=435907 RepID=UPI001407F61D|nr:Ku protein [Marinobacter salicampi]